MAFLIARIFTIKNATHSPARLEVAISTSNNFLQVPIFFNGCIIQQPTILNIQRVLHDPLHCLRSHLVWQVTPTNDYFHWVTWDKLSPSLLGPFSTSHLQSGPGQKCVNNDFVVAGAGRGRILSLASKAWYEGDFKHYLSNTETNMSIVLKFNYVGHTLIQNEIMFGPTPLLHHLVGWSWLMSL